MTVRPQVKKLNEVSNQHDFWEYVGNVFCWYDSEEHRARKHLAGVLQRGILNKDVVKESLKEADVQRDIDGDLIRLVFLGTVFALYPSGKFYTPWACSNVEKWEAEVDEIYGEVLEAEASELGCWIASGEGDPCDIFIGQCVEEDELTEEELEALDD
jgi:hypothetical protein